jgi:protocatechuate 3,4-dioxygenase beta subunit
MMLWAGQAATNARLKVAFHSAYPARTGYGSDRPLPRAAHIRFSSVSEPAGLSSPCLPSGAGMSSPGPGGMPG